MNLLRFLREQARNYDCGVCGSNHSSSEISVLGKREGAWVVRVACAKCHTTLTLLVYVGEKVPGATAVEGRPRRPALTHDDILDAHDLLGSYTGDARALFATDEKVKSPTSS